MTKKIQYIVNASGERTAVIVPIEDYENMLEDLHVLAAAYEAKDGPSIPFSEVLAELRTVGKIDP